MDFQYHITYGCTDVEPGGDWYEKSTIWLKNKCLKQVKAEMSFGMFARGEYEILSYDLAGAPIEKEQSIEAIWNIAMMIYSQPNAEPVVEYLKRLFKHYDDSYGGEFDFSDNESLQSFIENFKGCYLGLYPGSSNKLSLRLHADNNLPKLDKCFADYPEVEKCFGWATYTNLLLSQGNIWMVEAPEHRWRIDKDGVVSDHYVFRNISDYSTIE